MPVIHTAGADVHYIRQGRGPAVLLIHGVGVIGEFWRPQIDALADRFTLIAPDNRGIGGSTIKDRTLTIEAMAADAIAVMDAERVDRFHVVGHSMGGSIAQEVALAARARVLTLTLSCSMARGREAWPLSPRLLWSALMTRIGTARSRRDAYLELAMSRAYLDRTGRDEAAALITRLFGHPVNQQPAIVFRQVAAVLRYDARDRLSTLDGLPTLVMGAAEDRILRPSSSRALAEAIPGARYVEIEKAGHALPIEEAAKVAALLAEHFEKTR
jgi:pimeloyl-ACP methyl ester carboxylesterase